MENIGNFGDVPNDKYKKFFEKFNEIETLDIKQWRPNHLIGYFCKKYKSAYNINYQFKFNSPSPSKCFEVFQIKKLGLSLSTKPVILKEYIDWAFENKVKNGKRRLTSISFINNEELVNNYKMGVLFAVKTDLQIDRSSPLPPEIKEIIKSIGNLNTYGDLAFTWQAHKNYSLGDDANYVFDKLTQINFDFSILERVV